MTDEETGAPEEPSFESTLHYMAGPVLKVGLLCPFLTSSTILHFVFRPTDFLAQEQGEQLVSVSFFDGSRSFLKFNPILLNNILMPSAPFVLSANMILRRYYVPHTAGSQSDFKNTTLSLYPY